METRIILWTGLAALIVTFGAAGPGAGHDVPNTDGRLVQPYGLTVFAHIPVAAGYEPVPTPQHCLEGTPITGTFYSQDFEGAHGYAFVGTSLAQGADNLWSVTDYDGVGSDTGHSGDSRLYYGSPSTGDYDFGHTAGVAQSPSISIPSQGPVVLGFATKWQVEWLKGYDHLWVEALDTSANKIHLLCTANAYDRGDPMGGFGQTAVPSCSPYHFNPCPLEVGLAWEKRMIQLPQSLLGKSIKIRFTFDSADDKANIYNGWMVDDVVLGRGVSP